MIRGSGAADGQGSKYVGLFSLLFPWLFAVSGVIMNHPLRFGGSPSESIGQIGEWWWMSIFRVGEHL